MNQKRKAELQRKLSMMPVPRPPVGLADRIKADIPDDLATVTSRSGRTSPAFAMRIAASILIVLASTAFVSLYLMRGRKSAPLLPAMAPPSSAVHVISPPEALPEAQLTVSIDEKPRAKDSAAPAMTMAQSRPPAGPVPTQGRAESQEQFAPTVVAEAAPIDTTENRASRQASGSLGASSVDSARGAITASPAAPVVAEARPPAAPAAAPMPQRVEQARADTMNVAGGVRAERREEAVMKTAGLATASDAPREMFGISIDPDAISRVQKTIDSGRRPAASSVDVDAIVSYLASPAAATSGGVSFDVEASREPDVINSRATMIRFTIDTPPAASANRSIGSDAKLEIRFDDIAVSSYRILGDGKPLTLKEPLLFDNASVTGVIEVNLNNGIAPYHEVAKFNFHYRDARGRQQTIRKIVRVHDLQRSWEMASFRHRLATLGAIWGESIKGGPATAVVARTAEELATEAPRDEKARELANAANASSRLDRSGGGPGASGPGSR